MHNVGYVLITYGVIDAICSASFGGFIKYVGRVPIFLGGACLNLICVIVLFVWEPSPDMSYLFFIIAGLWGAADAVWQTQINGKIGVYFRWLLKREPKKAFQIFNSFDFAALYGVLFESDEEAAFSNYRLWESLGFIFAYILQTQVCIYSKLWVIIAVLGVGILGYLAIELAEFNRKKSSSNNTA